MADNLTTVNTGTGALPVATVIATRDTGTSHWQQVDASPAQMTVVAGGQFPLSVSTSGTTSLTVPSNATHALVSIDSGGSASGVRCVWDGSSSSTAGHFLAAGASMWIDNLSSFRMTAITGTASAQISYFRYL